MNKIKVFVKKYTSSFSFYYNYLGNKIFLVLFLSLLISFLDAMGLTMFFPLIQMLMNEGSIDISSMGKIGKLIGFIQNLGGSLSLGKIIFLMLLFFILKGLAKYLASIYLIVLQQAFIRNIRLYLLQGLAQFDFKKFMLADSGRIQNTLSGEIDRISNSFATYFGTLKSILMFFVYLGFVFFIDARFAILLIGVGFISHLLFRLIYSKTREVSTSLTDENHNFQGKIIQFVAHFKYLRSTGTIDVFYKKIKKTVYKIEEFRKRLGFLNSIGGAVIEPVVILILSLTIWIQIRFFEGNIGSTLVSLLFFYRVLTSLIGFQAQWNSFLKVSGSLRNVEDFMEELNQNKTIDGKNKFEGFENQIQLKELSFSYADQQVLKGINLDISKNESIAFVGESGSGKTTLVNLIVGLLQPDQGEIEIDNQPIMDFQAQSFQSKIGYVNQDPVIFNDSIYNNITFWSEKNGFNRNKFEESLRKSSLDGFVASLKNKEETLLGNNGINLSGGQKQRISIAREMFKDVEILILDEATSSLDSETEKAIQDSIENLKGKYTLLIVAHRLSTIKNVDRIVLMKNGEILDIDTFENLIQNQPIFENMVKLQEL